mmetsp:Transcript_105936/g.297884  ORF Transcript_105936/g.297884 Transcript_105936/m.297884 type:complete len:82 (+) Transcript_105936:225-470(+)
MSSQVESDAISASIHFLKQPCAMGKVSKGSLARTGAILTTRGSSVRGLARTEEREATMFEIFKVGAHSRYCMFRRHMLRHI